MRWGTRRRRRGREPEASGEEQSPDDRTPARTAPAPKPAEPSRRPGRDVRTIEALARAAGDESKEAVEELIDVVMDASEIVELRGRAWAALESIYYSTSGSFGEWADRRVMQRGAKRPFAEGPDGGPDSGPDQAAHLLRRLEASDPGTDPYSFGKLCEELGAARVDAAVPKLVALLEARGRHGLSGGIGGPRNAAISALGSIGDAGAVGALVTELENRPSHYAASALGEIGDAAAVAPLIAALGSDEASVRRGAAGALGKIGDRRAVEALQALLDDAEASVREAGRHALKLLGATDSEWYLEAIDTRRHQGRLIEMGLIDAETASAMGVRGTSRVRSIGPATIDAATQRLVLSNAKLSDGVCIHTTEIARTDLAITSPDRPQPEGFACGGCGAFVELRAALTDTADAGQELWVLTYLMAVPDRARGSPYLGWPLLMPEADVTLERRQDDGAAAPTGTWGMEPAGPERGELTEDGQLSRENLDAMNVYRLVPAPGAELGSGDRVRLRGTLTCNCGYEAPVHAEIGVEGFFDGPSQLQLSCPQCNAVNGVVGTTTRPASRARRHWLLVRQETGPPGVSYMPGTASGLPEIDMEEVTKAEMSR